MADNKKREISSHPIAQALGVGASAVTVFSFLAGVAVLVWAFVSDKLALGLTAVLVLSLVFNVFFYLRLRKKSEDAASVGHDAQTSAVQTYRYTSEEREAAKNVLEALDVAMDRFDYDWMHGLDDAGDEGRRAALAAKSSAEVITDATIRGMVGAFTDHLLRTPRGWWQESGATHQQADDLRRRHDDAVQAVGSVLRP